MPGKGPEESFFRAFAVSDHHGIGESLFEFRPKREQARGVLEVIGGDPVDFLSRPLDVLIAREVRDIGFVVAGLIRPVS